MKLMALLCIITANVLGGISYLWQDLALDGLPPATLGAGRTLVGVVCLGTLLLATGGIRLRFPPRDFLRLLTVGVLAFGLPLWLGIEGVQRSSAGNAAILILLEPVSILVLSRVLLGERIRGIQAVGIAAGLVGALCIVLEDAPWQELFRDRHFHGNLILAAHGVLWGLYSPLVKPLAVRYRSRDITFAVMFLSLLVLVPAALLEARAGLWQSGPDLSRSLVWMGVLGVTVSFGATFLWNTSLRHLMAFTVGAFVFLQPVTGVLADYVVQDVRPSGAGLVGCGIIGVGVLLVLLPLRQRT